MTLLEATRRKCDFLERWARELPNAHVVCGRAEEQPVDSWGVAVAKALAPPPVAAEWCLPLVGREAPWCSTSVRRRRPTGSRAWRSSSPQSSKSRAGLLVLRKLGPTPAGFPRRPGVARKRPLA